ncbi:GNAT family N-acetyltransferase [Helicobacter valdiviensis]|uniref:GNAT family N-acetyltransferase n=1 Tax=Helicobacter valdiviensis TaxID=1458358 RepID=A0A2W6PLP4_9HELI|nr:GNAT family N-acetyltransferase [Helicobacter valdiviensis]PZT47573.1 GNAT family N-acetyltransferase [Helicobacter valdiviensis]
MQITLQEITHNELKTIFPLMQQLRPTLNFDDFSNKFSLMQKEQNYKLFGFMQNGKFVALCGTMPFNVLYRENCLYICDFVVDENLRGQGIGEACLLQIFKLAKNEGYQQIELSSSFKRERAHKFYTEKMGFSKVSFVFVKNL